MHNGHELIKMELVTETPPGRICKNGHVATSHFINQMGEKLPNRFFKVDGFGIDKSLKGVYCEYCIAIATALAKEKRNAS